MSEETAVVRLPKATIAAEIPEGLPKSGRVWKQKQVYRASAQQRKGILSDLSTTFEQKQAQREKLKALKELEKEMKEEKQRKKEEAKQRREEQLKRRQANELKTAVYQQVRIIIVLNCHSLIHITYLFL